MGRGGECSGKFVSALVHGRESVDQVFRAPESLGEFHPRLWQLNVAKEFSH